MIVYLAGKILEKDSNNLIIDVNGVGYQVFITTRLYEKLPAIGSFFNIHTLLIVREDGHYLYGFEDKPEKKLFEQLISISGIGPKTAIAILSTLEPSKFRQYINENNIVLLSKLPGIGKKTAERLCLELRDKIESSFVTGAKVDNYLEDAILALQTLGYNKQIAERSINSALKDYPDIEKKTEIIIKFALKYVLK